MFIHVVSPGDTIYSIAESYGVTIAKLVRDNDLLNPDSLVPGQTIVIAYPEQTYIVKEEDTLDSIAGTFNVNIMQLLRNNPSLSNREYLEIGEEIVIRYKTGRKIFTNGFSYPFIDKEILKKNLPFLTYHTIFNYTATREGNIITYYDETEAVEITKVYGAIPLMMISTLSTSGKPNLETVYEILLNEEVQEHLIENALAILKSKGFYGVNFIFSYLNETNQKLYQNFLAKVYERLHSEGYLVFVTINPNVRNAENQPQFENIDYTALSNLADNFTFFNFVWGTNYSPPSPVSSNYRMKIFLDYVSPMIASDKLFIGTPVQGYNWELPYSSFGSGANSLTLNSAISLAHDLNIPIEFDEISKTPYFQYNQINFGLPIQHMIWFVDARTIDALMKLVEEYNLKGSGIWNIMIFYTQMWLVINSQYEIVKITDFFDNDNI